MDNAYSLAQPLLCAAFDKLLQFPSNALIVLHVSHLFDNPNHLNIGAFAARQKMAIQELLYQFPASIQYYRLIHQHFYNKK